MLKIIKICVICFSLVITSVSSQERLIFNLADAKVLTDNDVYKQKYNKEKIRKFVQSEFLLFAGHVDTLKLPTTVRNNFLTHYSTVLSSEASEIVKNMFLQSSEEVDLTPKLYSLRKGYDEISSLHGKYMKKVRELDSKKYEAFDKIRALNRNIDYINSKRGRDGTLRSSYQKSLLAQDNKTLIITADELAELDKVDLQPVFNKIFSDFL